MTGCGFGPFHAHWPDWTALDPLLRANLHAHGDFPKWQRALENLPAVDAQSAAYGDTVSVDGPITASARTVLNDALLSLHPWRKGPFSLFGIQIDSEWRSDIKWRRVAPHVDLKGARVLDVGCGNGYYGWRMLEAGAEFVLGIDPTVLYGMQHRAIDHCIGDHRNQVLPLALEALPEALCGERFDAVFSMGVIYHRRDPLDHLQRLAQCLVPGGKAVVESLIVDAPQPCNPPAAMRACATSGWYPHPATCGAGWQMRVSSTSAWWIRPAPPLPNSAPPSGCATTPWPVPSTRRTAPAPSRATRHRGAAC